MYVYDAINTAVSLVPSEVTRSTMVQWLSALDGQLWEEIVSQYVDTDGETIPDEMPAYTDSDDTNSAHTEMMVQPPYDLLYVDYLVMRIHLQNADYERYNNAAVQFNEQQRAWMNWYNRNHIHKKRVTAPDEGRFPTWIRF